MRCSSTNKCLPGNNSTLIPVPFYVICRVGCPALWLSTLRNWPLSPNLLHPAHHIHLGPLTIGEPSPFLPRINLPRNAPLAKDNPRPLPHPPQRPLPRGIARVRPELAVCAARVGAGRRHQRWQPLFNIDSRRVENDVVALSHCRGCAPVYPGHIRTAQTRPQRGRADHHYHLRLRGEQPALVVFQCGRAFDWVAEQTRNPAPVGLASSGALGYVVLAFLHYRVAWWPLHPVGLAVASTWMIKRIAFSVFLAWAAPRRGGALPARAGGGFFCGVFLSFVIDCGWFKGTGHPILHG